MEWVEQQVVLANGAEADAFRSRVEGVRSTPVVAHVGLPLGPRGHVHTLPAL
ncbi:hypothetical protein ACGFWD_36230 [Streptomyces sp. NPDC048448]